MTSYLNTTPCECGKTHLPIECEIFIGNGVITKLPELLKQFNAQKPFVFFDTHTYEAAGNTVCKLLQADKISYSSFMFTDEHLEPDERSVGSVFMHYDTSCDIIISVGSGVINDIGKILSVMTKTKYIIVATAPSMDGYASASSSMTRNGLKISLPTKNADAIIGDINILKAAPLHMLKAGIGDMLAKYISIGEWKISHIITNEYYCEQVAELVRNALHRCVDNASGLLKRDEKAVEAVFEGLIIGGIAMAYAGVSRPASGVEHYFSHIWDMRGVALDTPVDLHGIQCGVGTLYAAQVYDKIRTVIPNKEKAIAYIRSFDFDDYKKTLRTFVGAGAESMIEAEEKDGKYDVLKHSERIDTIIGKWDKIIEVINSEIPSAADIAKILDVIEAPKSCSAFGISETILKMTFKATKDIRDKYVASRLCFDLGIIDDINFS